MNNERLQRTLYILLLIAAGVYLFEKFFGLYQLFSHVVMLFSLAWLIAFTLSPLVDSLTSWRVALPVGRGVVREIYPPRAIGVMAIYLFLLLAVVGAGFYLVPLVLNQLVQFQGALVQYVRDFPANISSWQRYLAEHNIDINLATTFLTQSQLIGQLTKVLTDWGTQIVQNIPLILNGLFSTSIDLTIIMVMSFYMTLDGPTIVQRAIGSMPDAWRPDAAILARVIDLRFGSFIRSMLLEGLIYGMATAAIMQFAGLEYIAVASLIGAVVIMIPLVGGYLAVIAPVVIALFHSPALALVVYLVLFVFQQVLFHVLMPRLTGTIVGLHPLIIFLALLTGLPIAGVWGSIFAVPIAGVVVSVIDFVRAKMAGRPAEEVLIGLQPQAATHPPPGESGMPVTPATENAEKI